MMRTIEPPTDGVHRLVPSRFQRTNMVVDKMQFSNDGKFLFVGVGNIYVYEIETMTKVKEMQGDFSDFWLDNTDTKIILKQFDSSELFDLTTNRRVGVMPCFEPGDIDRIYMVHWPKTKAEIYVRTLRKIYVVCSQTLRLLRRFRSDESYRITSLLFGEECVIIARDRQGVSIEAISNLDVIHASMRPDFSNILEMSWFDNTHLFFRTRKNMFLVTFPGLKVVIKMPSDARANWIPISCVVHGTRYVYCVNGPTIELVDLSRKVNVSSYPIDHGQRMKEMVVSPRGRHVVTAGYDNVIYTYNVVPVLPIKSVEMYNYFQSLMLLQRLGVSVPKHVMIMIAKYTIY